MRITGSTWHGPQLTCLDYSAHASHPHFCPNFLSRLAALCAHPLQSARAPAPAETRFYRPVHGERLHHAASFSDVLFGDTAAFCGCFHHPDRPFHVTVIPGNVG